MNCAQQVALIVLDGWGYRKETLYNAIAQANTPCWDGLCNKYPHTLLDCCGEAVGLPHGQVGNSEVGHLTLGAGRVYRQSLLEIEQAISRSDFFDNKVLIDALTRSSDTAIHLFGLLSGGGVHSHESHLYALLDLVNKLQLRNTIYIHVILDGRDTAPKAALSSIVTLEKRIAGCSLIKIASVVGRYFAMDRDNNLARTKLTYDLLTSGKAKFIASSASAAVDMAYKRGETDEFVLPTAICLSEDSAKSIQDDDTVIVYNFRADRVRQICSALVCSDFVGFERNSFPKIKLVTFTEYADDLTAEVVFPKRRIKNSLGEVLAKNNFTQLRIAETEKYAHVTFFFNGGREQPFEKEQRILLPSPKVATYDMLPQMSANAIADELVKAILGRKYNFMLANFANADMVGHTGDLQAAIKAVETVDSCLAKIVQAMQTVKGTCLITADHGNAELMFDRQPHKAHTNSPVPLVCVGDRDYRFIKQAKELRDVAPLILSLFDIERPKEMAG